ncbi:hypothetical protein D3C87_1373290 [compost metagenome]
MLPIWNAVPCGQRKYARAKGMLISVPSSGTPICQPTSRRAMRSVSMPQTRVPMVDPVPPTTPTRNPASCKLRPWERIRKLGLQVPMA